MAFGALVGIGELVARYRDDPLASLMTPSAIIYIVANAIASVSALALIRAFGWQFGLTDAPDKAQDWVQVLIAGFGAMAFFRSSLFLVRVGDQDVGVGPSGFLQVALNAADRGVDRNRAAKRAKVVPTIMKDVSFEKAKAALPSFCIALMQNLSEAEQTEISNAVALLDSASMDPGAKQLNLGLLLMNYVGQDVLEQAVLALADDVKP